MGTYYWFENGARINNAWRSAWGYRYYVDGEGRAVQGLRTIGGKRYHFGADGTFYLRTNQTVAHNQEKYRASSTGELQPWSGYFDTPAGWRWIENGQMYTGFRFYMGAYYYFRNVCANIINLCRSGGCTIMSGMTAVQCKAFT